MADSVGIRSSLLVLLVVAGILILVGWFVWSQRAQHPVPTAPKPASELILQSGRLVRS